MPCVHDFAELSKNDVKKVKDLEKELDVLLLAYKMSEFADLKKSDLKLLQDTEKKLGVTLLAFK
ncbi:MAG: hypothetical protein LUO79_09190 [Methanomassiliicoccales archaeon]|nr:hypothetical protein [Methanomassiliicoccales archaeon]